MGARVPPDVPVHRPSVGADPTNMGTLMPDNFYENFKPYVYRGTGIDTLTPHIGEDWERGKGAPEPTTTTRKRTKARKRKRKARPSRWMQEKQARRREAAEIAERNRIALRARIEAQQLLDTYYTEPEPEPERYRLGDPRHPEHSRYYRNARPAKGWEPMKGDDIDALLDELSD